MVKRRWICMLRIIASNLVVEKYATTFVYLETLFFPQFIENSRLYFNGWNTWVSSKKTRLLSGKIIDTSTENLSGITDVHQNYEKCECEGNIVIGASKRTRKWKLQLKISKNSNLYLKVGLSQFLAIVFFFRFTFQSTELI